MRYLLLAVILAGCSSSSASSPQDASADVAYNCAIDCRLYDLCAATCAPLTRGADLFCAMACTPSCNTPGDTVDCDQSGYRCTHGPGAVYCGPR